MSNSTPMVPKNFSLPKGIADEPEDKLQGGRPSFAVVIQPNRGTWGLRFQQNDELNLDQEGNPLPNFDVVIIKSRENLSNRFYFKWEANTKKPPDCFASDGVTPDDRVDPATKQHPTCAGCPQKKMGSALTASGKATTACRNERKIAVIPYKDLVSGEYENYNGPALYVVTPTALKNYTKYLDHLKAVGGRTFAVVTRMRHDPDPAIKHQKPIFSIVKGLSQDEFELVKKLRHDPRTAIVLEEEPEADSILPEDDVEDAVIIQPTSKPTTPKPTPPAPPKYPKFNMPEEAVTPPAPPRPTAPPPPKPGGFAATAQTVAAAMTKPAPRPVQVRPVNPAPVEETEEEQEEILDDETVGVGDSLDEELDNDLKRLLAGDE